MKETSPAILIVDDDPVSVELIRSNLYAFGYHRVTVATDGTSALEEIRNRPHSLVLLDLVLPDISGVDVLRTTVEEMPDLPVIVLTGTDSVDTAVECMRIGAFDYLTKPPDRNRLRSGISHALKVLDLEKRLSLLSGAVSETDEPLRPEIFSEIKTRSPRMRAVFTYIEAIADSPKAVLISGESGTGKELVARAIHNAGAREGAFVPVNVAGTDDTMFTDTLFGHIRGAFTGADRARNGLVERARGGTLFLDEIGDLERSSQTKLLRLLQEGEYYPLGSDEAHTADLRIVAATNANLMEKQADGSFRKDLYYRLVSHHILIPPLRERTEDIEILIEHFVAETAAAIGRDVPRIPAAVPEMLRRYPFPGNVRELQAIIADAMSRSRGSELSATVVRSYLDLYGETNAASPGQADGGDRFCWNGSFPTIEEVTDYLIDEALKRTANNQSAAARLLGVSQSTLSRRLKNS